MRCQPKATKAVLVLTASVLLFSCSSGSNSTTPAPDRATNETIISLITTEIGTETAEGWACVDGDGEASVYTFYDLGAVEGLENLRMGTEYFIRPNEEPFNYNWVVVDNESLVLRSQPLNLQDVWTNVEFSGPSSTERLMRARSSTRGQLHCSIGVTNA